MTNKKTTKELVREWRSRDPNALATEMARELGVSHQRVCQILRALGLPTRTSRVSPLSGRKLGRRKSPPRIPVEGIGTVDHLTAGLIGELLVAADLAARGYVVFAPLQRHLGSADLVAVPKAGARAITFEVRCGRRRADGSVAYRKDRHDRCDHYAAVASGAPVVYEPPLPPPATRTSGDE